MIFLGWLIFTAALGVLAWWCGREYGRDEGRTEERHRWLMGMARATTLPKGEVRLNRAGIYWLTSKGEAALLERAREQEKK